jgi:segregation and condensation protein A
MLQPVTTSEYRVELDLFSGPLDLLLYLVKRNEVDVGEVSLARIAAQFVAFLEVLQFVDLDLAGEFLVTASTLIEIKSRSVLPQEEVAEADDAPSEDLARSELVRRLLEYRKFKEAAAQLQERASRWQERYPRLSIEQPVEGNDPVEDRIREVELWDLVSALGRVLQKKELVGSAQLQRDETPVAVLVERIGERVRREGRVAFSDCFEGVRERGRIVGVFLAVLELLRHHGFRAEQPTDYGEIWIEPPADSTEQA